MEGLVEVLCVQSRLLLATACEPACLLSFTPRPTRVSRSNRVGKRIGFGLFRHCCERRGRKSFRSLRARTQHDRGPIADDATGLPRTTIDLPPWQSKCSLGPPRNGTTAVLFSRSADCCHRGIHHCTTSPGNKSPASEDV